MAVERVFVCRTAWEEVTFEDPFVSINKPGPEAEEDVGAVAVVLLPAAEDDAEEDTGLTTSDFPPLHPPVCTMLW